MNRMASIADQHWVERDLTTGETHHVHVKNVYVFHPDQSRPSTRQLVLSIVISAITWTVIFHLIGLVAHGQTVTYSLAHPSPRAVHERAQTIEAHRDHVHRIHIVRAEQEAQRAVEEAPAPMPIPRGPSTGGTIVNLYNVISTGMPTHVHGYPPAAVVPPTVGMAPEAYYYVYMPMLRRFRDGM
jgi:hypothetical protein